MTKVYLESASILPDVRAAIYASGGCVGDTLDDGTCLVTVPVQSVDELGAVLRQYRPQFHGAPADAPPDRTECAVRRIGALRFVDENGGPATALSNIHIERRANGNERQRGEWVRLTVEPIQRADVFDLTYRFCEFCLMVTGKVEV